MPHALRRASAVVLRRAVAWLAAAGLLVALGASPSARAQAPEADTTRHGRLAAARAAKAEARTPTPEPGFIESSIRWLEHRGVLPDLAESGDFDIERPWRVLPGGIGPGTGIGGRLGYAPFYARDDLDVLVSAGATLQGYWQVEATAGHRVGRFFGYAVARRSYRRDSYVLSERARGEIVGAARDATEALPEDGVMRYDLDAWRASGLAGVQLLGPLRMALGSSFATYAPALGDDAPEGITSGAALGVARTTRYLSLDAHAVLDTRDARYVCGFGECYAPGTNDLTNRPLSPHSGTLLAVKASRFYETTDVRGTFSQLRVEAQQYLSFWQRYHTLALRHRTVLTDPDEDDGVPFYQLPHLGGPHTLRGYDNFRFRNLHALLFNIEYRWQVWLLADLVLFADAGKTFARARQWGLTNLRTSYGGGLRFVTGRSTLLRLEVARNPSSGTRVIIRFNSAF